jgi:hypothetical protein
MVVISVCFQSRIFSTLLDVGQLARLRNRTYDIGNAIAIIPALDGMSPDGLITRKKSISRLACLSDSEGKARSLGVKNLILYILFYYYGDKLYNITLLLFNASISFHLIPLSNASMLPLESSVQWL